MSGDTDTDAGAYATSGFDPENAYLYEAVDPAMPASFAEQAALAIQVTKARGDQQRLVIDEQHPGLARAGAALAVNRDDAAHQRLGQFVHGQFQQRRKGCAMVGMPQREQNFVSFETCCCPQLGQCIDSLLK